MATAFKQVKASQGSTVQAGSTVIGSAVGTSLTVGSGHGLRFPSPGNPFWITIWNGSTYSNPNLDPNQEKMLCTARSTDVLTVTRAQLGSSAATTIAAGYAVQLLVEDQQLTDMQTAINAVENGGAFAQLNDSNGNKAVQLTPATTPVNFVDVANAATAGIPALTGTGTDTDVGLNLKTKGAGMLYENSVSFPTIRSELVPGNFIASGLDFGTNGGLSINHSAGVAYIGGVRYAIAAKTPITVVASADNYIGYTSAGVFTQSSVAPGAAAPTFPTGGIWLGKCTTNATDPTAFAEAGNWDSNGHPFHPVAGAGQIIGRAFSTGTATTGVTTTATDITNMSATFTVSTKRLVEIIFSLPVYSSVVNDIYGVRLMEGATQLSIIQMAVNPVASNDTSVTGHFFLTATAGTHTYKLTLRREAGSGTLAADVGPNFPQSLIIKAA